MESYIKKHRHFNAFEKQDANNSLLRTNVIKHGMIGQNNEPGVSKYGL